jgi:hypothetical protein
MASHYRQFIPNFSTTASALKWLLKNDTKFRWTEPQDHAFLALKSKLMTQMVLQYPDSLKEFILMADNSNSCLGAVLSQGDTSNDLPTVYATSSLNKTD